MFSLVRSLIGCEDYMGILPDLNTAFLSQLRTNVTAQNLV